MEFPKGADLDRTLRQIGRALHEIGDDAADFGIEIRVEVHGSVTSQLPHFAKILQYAAHPNVYACWNSNPSDVKDGSIKETFTLVAPKVHEVHLRDLTDEAYPWRQLLRPFERPEIRGLHPGGDSREHGPGPRAPLFPFPLAGLSAAAMKSSKQVLKVGLFIIGQRPALRQDDARVGDAVGRHLKSHAASRRIIHSHASHPFAVQERGDFLGFEPAAAESPRPGCWDKRRRWSRRPVHRVRPPEREPEARAPGQRRALGRALRDAAAREPHRRGNNPAAPVFRRIRDRADPPERRHPQARSQGRIDDRDLMTSSHRS